MPKPALVELIQLHERKWGEQQYPGRPTLDQLLNGYVLAMWMIGKRFVFSVHKDAQELNDLIFNLVTGKVDDPDHRKLARIFINRIEYEFRIGIVPRKVRPPTKPHAEATRIKQPTEPLARQPQVVPLPPQPNKRYGQALPGRHVTPLPGRTVKLRRGKKD